MSFQDLERDELYRTALEDFAVQVHHAAGKDKIIEALNTDGVTWEMYTSKNPGAAGIEEPEPVVAERTTVADGVITSDVVTGKVAEPVLRTKKEEINVAANDIWLVHMDRENPYFEFRGESKLHKFTQENPFAVMSASDANLITSSEEGFSIATPAQAAAFYEKRN